MPLALAVRVTVFLRAPDFAVVFLAVLVAVFFFACAIKNSFIILMIIIARWRGIVKCGIIVKWMQMKLEKSF